MLCLTWGTYQSLAVPRVTECSLSCSQVSLPLLDSPMRGPASTWLATGLAQLHTRLRVTSKGPGARGGGWSEAHSSPEVVADPRCQSGKHLPGACGAPRPRECPCPGSHAGARPLLCSQGRFIIRGAGWGGVRACVDAQLRKCRGHQAHSGREGAMGQGCGSEVVSWDFHCPRDAPASSTLSSEVPQLETGPGAGEPRLRALLQVGVSGDRGRHRASRRGEQWQLAPELGGHWDTQSAPSQEARQLPRAWSASGRGSREGQGRLRGPGVRQSLRSGTQVLGAGTHGGSFWFLVGLVGAEGTAG